MPAELVLKCRKGMEYLASFSNFLPKNLFFTNMVIM